MDNYVPSTKCSGCWSECVKSSTFTDEPTSTRKRPHMLLSLREKINLFLYKWEKNREKERKCVDQTKNKTKTTHENVPFGFIIITVTIIDIFIFLWIPFLPWKSRLVFSLLNFINTMRFFLQIKKFNMQHGDIVLRTIYIRCGCSSMLLFKSKKPICTPLRWRKNAVSVQKNWFWSNLFSEYGSHSVSEYQTNRMETFLDRLFLLYAKILNKISQEASSSKTLVSLHYIGTNVSKYLLFNR